MTISPSEDWRAIWQASFLCYTWPVYGAFLIAAPVAFRNSLLSGWGKLSNWAFILLQPAFPLLIITSGILFSNTDGKGSELRDWLALLPMALFALQFLSGIYLIYQTKEIKKMEIKKYVWVLLVLVLIQCFTSFYPMMLASMAIAHDYL